MPGESEASGFTSGGGFSNVFARPDYQQTAVTNFLSNVAGLPPSSTYNGTGRGFPDVSANGYAIANFQSGVYYLEGGTSASAPIFASIISRLNGERILAGKAPVGFLNNILYQHPEMFDDVVGGSFHLSQKENLNTYLHSPRRQLGMQRTDCL